MPSEVSVSEASRPRAVAACRGDRPALASGRRDRVAGKRSVKSTAAKPALAGFYGSTTREMLTLAKLHDVTAFRVWCPG